jgi:peptide methionine sulfoxide reductase MsrA
VKHTSVGYTQGRDHKPDYHIACGGNSAHTEAIQCYFDETEVSYRDLLETFMGSIDITTINGQVECFARVLCNPCRLWQP